MWDIYDELIDSIPDDLVVEEFLAGMYWFIIRSQGTGMAMSPREGGKPVSIAGSVKGKKLRDVSAYVKSWNNVEAAMGLAAINSYVNAPENIRRIADIESCAQTSFFDVIAEKVKGKKVAVVGHFRGLEKIASDSSLCILERIPVENDLPDPACEYILPEQDFVFITGTTLINKTLPRLLELSKNATVALVGPSAPMCPVLFRYGVDIIAGTAVLDSAKVWNFIQEGTQHRFFDEGSRMVVIDKKKINQ